MEINEQLFEDVLAGKLEGTFVLKNGFKVSSDRLCKKDKDVAYKYWLKGFSPLYAIDGIPNSIFARNYAIVDFIPKYKTIDLDMLEYCRKDFEFMQTLSKTINNMNTLEIEIPEGKEIDWKESEKQNKIVLKDKQLTYNDVCKKLFKNKEFFFINNTGVIQSSSPSSNEYFIDAANNSTSYHQLECIRAKNQLANVAVYLNNGWKPSHTSEVNYNAYVIYTTPKKDYIGVIEVSNCSQNSNVFFKSAELALKAIEILGKDTIKLALEPLGI
jgi:hypothetical protein